MMPQMQQQHGVPIPIPIPNNSNNAAPFSNFQLSIPSSVASSFTPTPTPVPTPANSYVAPSHVAHFRSGGNADGGGVSMTMLNQDVYRIQERMNQLHLHQQTAMQQPQEEQAMSLDEFTKEISFDGILNLETICAGKMEIP
jgi:hypothetical protein